MFSNLNWYNVVVLLLLALFIFGDKLPQMISDGLKMVRNLRRMAQNATTDLSRELGTNIQLEDLHPKTFVRKHLLSESEQEALTKPLRGLSEDLRKQTQGLREDLEGVGRHAQGVADDLRTAGGGSVTGGSAAGGSATGGPAGGGSAAGGSAIDPHGSTAAAPLKPRPSYDDIT